MTYMNLEEERARKEYFEKMEAAIFWGQPIDPKITPEQKEALRYANTIKFAWVETDGKRKILGVSNEDMKGYAMVPEYPAWKLPLEEEKYDKFERWCTTFDL